MPTEDEIRKERRSDAEERRIYSKADEIATRLGSDQPYRHGHYYRYGFRVVEGGAVEEDTSRTNGLSIVLDTGGPNLWIKWNGKEVYYHQIHDLQRYRPDIEGWIEELDRVHATLVPTMEREEAAEKSRRRTRVFNDWGKYPS